ncbi:MAG: hypothetical protein EB060_02370 [Proteobacteria bacterium]|nr:hypothetical protein [Pseudomonadota bacterium]
MTKFLIREAGSPDAKALAKLATDSWIEAFGHTVEEDPTDFLERTRSETYFTKAIRLYESFGFQVIGNRIYDIGDTTELVMQRKHKRD